MITKNMPIVVLNREVRQESIVNIVSEESKGAYRAVKCLVSMGHRKIAFMGGSAALKSSTECETGFVRAMLDNGLYVNRDYIVNGCNTPDGGYTAMKRLLVYGMRPTALFCANDDMAVGAMRAISDSGYSIPQDISVIGFGDCLYCKYIFPALSSISTPVNEIARLGAEKLMGVISGTQGGESIRVESELIIRESVSRIK